MPISLRDLELELDNNVSIINFKDKKIEIKQYLPSNEKLELISWVINQSADELKFYNVGKLAIFRDIALVQHYTNIEFTNDDLENASKLYDLLKCSGLFDEILNEISEEEYDWICLTLEDTVNSIYKYQNSIMGILDTVTTDYENLNFDVTELQKNISDPNNLTLLKDVVTKLG